MFENQKRGCSIEPAGVEMSKREALGETVGERTLAGSRRPVDCDDERPCAHASAPMALFAYRAVDAEGRLSNGSLDAANAIDLELRLRRLGLDLLTFETVKRSTAARTRNVSRTELITFCFHLSQLLKAGVNIIEALTDLAHMLVNTHEFRTRVVELAQEGAGSKP